MIDTQFWRGKRVFLTGHTGFKGSWLSLWLQDMGAEVTGYSLPPPSQPNLFDVAAVATGMVSIIGDIRDGKAVADTMKDARPEIVIHMAAQSLVRYSYEHPVETYSTNVMGLVNVFEAIRQTPGIKAVVNVTSDKCYDNKEWAWGYRESEPMGGYDPYSSSKGCAELITAAYRQSYFSPEAYAQHGTALGSGRAGNVIGGGDWAADRLIPDMMRALADSKTVLIRNPHAIRPWQHVLEPLGGYLLLASKLYLDGLKYAEGWNFGPADDDVKPVQWIVEKLTQKWGAGASWARDGQSGPHEATFLKLDCSKARAFLGWTPTWDLNHTLEKISEWHKAALDGADMRAMSVSQIHQFQQKCSGET